jgi:hypothetical protein
MRPRSLHHPFLVTAGLLVGLVASTILVAGPANAASQPVAGPVAGATATAGLVPGRPGGQAGRHGVGPAAITPSDVSPSGCVGTANNPHLSAHNPDVVNAEARTSCNGPVPEIFAEGALFQLISGVWTEVGFDSFLNVQATRASAFPNVPFCEGVQTFALVGFHEVTDVDFNDYEASTSTAPVSVNCD